MSMLGVTLSFEVSKSTSNVHWKINAPGVPMTRAFTPLGRHFYKNVGDTMLQPE